MAIDIGDILSGWTNYLFPTPEIRQKAKERLKICGSCDKSATGPLGTYPHCILCGCYLPAKVSSTKQDAIGCPENKWGQWA